MSFHLLFLYLLWFFLQIYKEISYQTSLLFVYV